MKNPADVLFKTIKVSASKYMIYKYLKQELIVQNGPFENHILYSWIIFINKLMFSSL